jgi:hypothetical protein
MIDPAADAARSAAAILAPELGPNLRAEVEAALAARDTEQRPDRYLDPVSLASLIVAIATLAWTIYNDQRKHIPDPPSSSIARQVRITLRDQDTPFAPRHRAHHRSGRHRDHPPDRPAGLARLRTPGAGTHATGETRRARGDPGPRLGPCLICAYSDPFTDVRLTRCAEFSDDSGSR